MKISSATYTRYMDKMEHMVQNWVLMMTDHGLLLNFKKHYDAIQASTKEWEDLWKEAKDSKNIWAKMHVLREMNNHHKLCIELEDDAKIVKEFKEIFEKLQTGQIKITKPSTNTT